MFFLKNFKWSNIIAVVMMSRCHTELSAHDFYIYKKVSELFDRKMYKG